MQTIASFKVNHLTLPCGVFLSRVDDDIVTYDIRTRKPNREKVMDCDGIHTIEHLFATFVRNSEFADNIVYFGPMGCRTGFYFITRGLPRSDALELIKNTFKFIAEYDGEIPGTSERECGNYLEHSLPKAKKEALRMCLILENWSTASLKYPE